MAQIAGEIAPVKLPLHDSHYKKNLPGKQPNTPSFRTIPSVTFCLPSICLCRPKDPRIGALFSNSRREMGSCVFGEWCPSRMPESHATGAPFYHVSGNTAKRKMRHLCGLFCMSCNIPNHNSIEQCYLFFIYIHIYINTLMTLLYFVLMSSLLSCSTCLKFELFFTFL